MIDVICPLMSSCGPEKDTTTTYCSKCQSNDCALWDDGNKCCCLKSISIELIKLTEGIKDATSHRGRK